MKQPTAVLRWHVSRAGPPGSVDGDGKETVQISLSRGSDLCLRTWRSVIQAPETISMDVFSWWEDMGVEIQVRANSDILIESLTERNLLIDRGVHVQPRLQRRLTEDMVLLQFHFDEMKFRMMWENVLSGDRNPSELVCLDSARWMDFTRQARRAASTVYGILLTSSTGRGNDDTQ